MNRLRLSEDASSARRPRRVSPGGKGVKPGQRSVSARSGQLTSRRRCPSRESASTAFGPRVTTPSAGRVRCTPRNDIRGLEVRVRRSARDFTVSGVTFDEGMATGIRFRCPQPRQGDRISARIPAEVTAIDVGHCSVRDPATGRPEAVVSGDQMLRLSLVIRAPRQGVAARGPQMSMSVPFRVVQLSWRTVRQGPIWRSLGVTG